MAEQFRADLLVSCLHDKAPDLMPALKAEVKRRGLEGEVRVVEAGCRGFCSMGPVLLVQPDGLFYIGLQAADVPELVEETLVKGRVVERLTYKEPTTRKRIPYYKDVPFYSKQMRVVLRNCGLLNPQSIDEYIAAGGYQALGKVLTSMTPEQVIAEIKKAGLRGRGGAGFTTGQKWEFARKAPGDVKYLVANGDEGDPGAFMDRSLLEGDPHGPLEGMIIGAYAIGAHQGFMYVRDEYPLAVKNIGIAIDQAREYGLLGKDILGSGFDFDVRVVRGAGAFVCGEETALIASIEGRAGNPHPRPPFPAQKGLWGKPTNINNVKTWANVPVIINNGADWFNKIGTETSKGTMIFSLVGKINNTGLVEVPMGITLRELIFDVGGGIPDKKRKFKAVQTGGPSGGCLPGDLLDLQVDYEHLTKAGSIMGSGGLIVMDEDTCMVDVARYFMDFLKDESCGKCTPCREGIRRMLEILNRITSGKGEMADLEVLETLGKVVKATSLCGLGQTAPNPLLSTLRYFRAEYESHIKDKFCPAGVCKGMFLYVIDPDKCPGCGLCIKACSQNAITGAKKVVHVIDPALCIQCGECVKACNLDAIKVVPKEAVGGNGKGTGVAVKEVVA
jgi:NADH:ubiquinone oxidoreductase subunit F (NADH-binding)/(2Fe-2S) ferredoxin/NAD-dependent dihydropyrimidine dehydrogenase PreA subunit